MPKEMTAEYKQRQRRIRLDLAVGDAMPYLVAAYSALSTSR